MVLIDNDEMLFIFVEFAEHICRRNEFCIIVSGAESELMKSVGKQLRR